MDQRAHPRPSGIPRLASRLPLPTSSASKPIRPSPSREKLRSDPGLDNSKLRRPSEDAVFKKPFPKCSPNKTSTGLQRDTSRTGRSDGRRSALEEVVINEANDPEIESVAEDAEARGRARPSLSERTIETLAQIPPSPASSRKSSFFNAKSPIRSPSRPPSSLTSYSRSPSRSSSRQPSGNDFLSQPTSAVRLPSRSRPSLSANNVPIEQTSLDVSDSPSKLRRPSPRPSAYGDVTPTKSIARPPSTRIPDSSGMETPRQSIQVKKTRKTPTNTPSFLKKPASTPTKSPSPKPSSTDLSEEQQSELDTRKAAKSSSALRETIAKAKAAKKAAMQAPAKPPPTESWDILDTPDPFNQGPKDPNKGVLRKRIESGRTSGHLNIAAMSLKELPQEVMTMYDFDPDSSTDWYESVDLVKFIAADNEFTELPDSAFPDVDPYNLDPEADEKGNQFGGLELLDLHGNLLQSLPVGFRRLQRLHTLNLSSNNLKMEDIAIVTEMEWLRDLRLAKNQLQGPLTSDIRRLTNLESLDLRENSLTTVPDDIAELSSLRVLNVSNNQLTSLPLDCLSKLPLRDLHSPRNRLSGTLIPRSVSKFETLQNLDVAGNSLTALSENDTLELPNLQYLSISINRVQLLPDVSSWQSLLTLSAEDNRLSAFPEGFTQLKNIRNVDFTGNDISKLDERIGLMDNLVTLRIANNPLRDRKFLNVSTEELKRDLRNRCEPEPLDTDDDEASVVTQFTLAPETPSQTATWEIKRGGVLDRSHTDMQDLDIQALERLNPDDVKCLFLQHNHLRTVPIQALNFLSHSLIDLDLSHNQLESTSIFTSPVNLPRLQTLNLSATSLTTLEPMLSNLTAPSLTVLDVSYNRLSGPLPVVRRGYPSLSTFLAADNQFDSLDFDAVQGLQALDVGNNNISSLPPKLGLLRAEGSSKNWGDGSALKRFEVSGNTFRVPRWQVVAKGTESILEWLKDRIPSEELSQWEPDHEHEG
ncbi:leucine-rich repeat protein [Aspergillus ambiguus]|uniref:uncharacterized protein n=1 Tax=Aspergillus ambiguus TaxID=176160 RepID=UPI003CCD7EE7